MLGTVRLGQASRSFICNGEHASIKDVAIPEIIESEKVWRTGKTAALTLTKISVDTYLHDPSFVLTRRHYSPVRAGVVGVLNITTFIDQGVLQVMPPPLSGVES